MSFKSRSYSEEEYQYVMDTSIRWPDGMRELINATQELPEAMMATAPVQGQFLNFMIKSLGATRAIEVGVFTGVGTMWMADAVGPDGVVIACDINEQFVSIGRPYWQQAGLADRIDVRLAPAQDTLQTLLTQYGPNSFDFCYIDADKESYGTYYKQVLALIRPGGVIAFDNMLMGGRAADPANTDEAVVVIRKLNETLHDDSRVSVSLLPICDGLYLIRKH